MPEDVKNADGSSPSELEEKDDSLEHPEADSDKSEGDESQKSIPYSRFKEVNEAKKQAEKVASWYQQNIGDPNDVVAFRQWKAEQVKKAEKAEDEGKISPEKLAEIRRVMRQADPEYAQMLELQKKAAEERIEAQFDDAEEIVRELSDKEFGLRSKDDESDISWLAQQTMLVVRGDEKLTRLWNAGNTDRCIRKAFKVVQERQDKLGKTISKMRQEAIDKRRVSKLSTLPSGQSTVTTRVKDKDRVPGLNNPQVGDEAWAVFKNSLQE